MSKKPTFPEQEIAAFLSGVNLKVEPTKKNLGKLLNCLDFTTLNSTDTHLEVENLIKTAKKLEKQNKQYALAAICTWPNYANFLVKKLAKSKTNAAVVAGGFPAAQAEQETKVFEVLLAAQAGVNEIDVVLNPGLIIAGEYKKAFRELKSMRKAVGKKVTLKVIIESGALLNTAQVFNASIIALEAGADFIKTSTGKTEVGATKEGFTTMLAALHWFNQENKTNRGIKASGGIKTTADALTYLALYEKYMNKEASKETFRIGASSVLNHILTDLEALGVSLKLDKPKNKGNY
ncbi:MAG: deoxyribose-phosphate aldolase [Luteibaculaceae bacterium]